MRRSTEFVLRHRRIVLAAWVVALVVGSAGAANVGSLLANTFSLPGSPAQRGLSLLHDRFHQRSDGAFTLVAVARGPTAMSVWEVCCGPSKSSTVTLAV